MKEHEPATEEENPEKQTIDQLRLEMKDIRRMFRGIRKQSDMRLLGLPFYDIALGPNFHKGELKGHAKGFIAVGNVATGIIAVGGLARGVVAIGGMALGLFAMGGCALGALAIGGGAAGLFAAGGGAVGVIAVGGGAFGYYAFGAGAYGKYVINVVNQSPEAIEFIKDWVPGFLLPEGFGIAPKK